MSISDKNQTKAELYQDHIFIRDDHTNNQIDLIQNPDTRSPAPSNNSLDVADECGNKCQNGCYCEEGYCINQPERAFLGDACEHSEPILNCGVDGIGIVFPAYKHYIADWKSDGFLHLGQDSKKENCRFTNESETFIPYDHWADCDGYLDTSLTETNDTVLTISNTVKRDIKDSVISFDVPIFEWECNYHFDLEPLDFETGFPKSTPQVATLIEIETINAQMTFYNKRK